MSRKMARNMWTSCRVKDLSEVYFWSQLSALRHMEQIQKVRRRSPDPAAFSTKNT